MKESVRMGLLWAIAIVAVVVGLLGSTLPSRRGADSSSERANALRLGAEQQLGAGNPDKALRGVMAAISANPEDAASWELLGDLRVRDERWEEALSAYERASMIDGHRARLWLQKARVFRALDELDAAQESVTHARTLAPDDPTVAAEAGAVAEARGRIQQAIDLYVLAAKATDPEQKADAEARLAAIHERRGDARAAADALIDAAESEPADETRWMRAADALERTGQLQDAAQAWERLANLREEPTAWENAARLHARRGSAEDARLAWERANAGGARPLAWAEIARQRLDEGDAAGADAAAARAFAARARDGRRETVAALGAVLLELGRAREAADLLQPHVRQTGDAVLADMLARAQAASGLERHAVGTCERVRGAEPGSFCRGLLGRDIG